MLRPAEMVRPVRLKFRCAAFADRACHRPENDDGPETNAYFSEGETSFGRSDHNVSVSRESTIPAAIAAP